MRSTSLAASIVATTLGLVATTAGAKGFDNLIRLPENCQERSCYCPKLEPRIRAALSADLRAVEADYLRTIKSNQASKDLHSAHFARDCDTAAVVFRPSRNGQFEVLRYSAAYVRGSVISRFLTRISLARQIRELRTQPFSYVPVTGKISIPRKYMPKGFTSPGDIDKPEGALYTEMRKKLSNREIRSSTHLSGDQVDISLLLEGDGPSLAKNLEQFHARANFGALGDLLRKITEKDWEDLSVDGQKEKMLDVLNECAIHNAGRTLKTAGRASKDIPLMHYVLTNGVVGYCGDYHLSGSDMGKGGKAVSLDNLNTVLLYGRPRTFQEATEYNTRELADSFGSFFGSVARGLSASAGD